ncbi:MAG: hypothetical protein QOC68_1302 [Solirubrobacteraceae bacterium]|nr:hypothetical protein [Solirubrobacteraceae bacterium]
MGILLLVAVIIGALIASNLDGKIAKATNDMVALIAGGGKDVPGGGAGGPGGSNPGGGTHPGGGGNGPGGGSSTDDETKKAIICLGSTAEAGNCIRAAGAPNAVSEKINERAREKLMKAQRKLYNTARPGTPEYVKALAERDAALKEYFDSRKVTNNFIVKPLAQVRKVVDPRYKDLQKGLTRFGKGARTAKAPLRPNTSSGGPITKSPASKFLKGLGKVGKGLGIAGTALSLYDNVKNDGLAKGLTKTAGGVGGAWAAGAGVVAVCGAVGVATAGVGGLACAGLALGASYFGGKYGSQLAGWGYDRAKDVAHFANDKVFKPVGHATTTAVNKVKDVGEQAIDGGKKVIGALNPFG